MSEKKITIQTFQASEHNPTHTAPLGHLQHAPESFLDANTISDISQNGIDSSRRRLLRGSFAAATAAMLMPVISQQARAEEGDPDILNLPPWSKMLGKSVASPSYGQPSKYEANIQRRQSPGLTQTDQASVSFSPLQGMFGMITASGLHFERHHQGWVDVDPRRHRLMINGLVNSPKVFTMEDLMRLPSVSRIHFIECGANTGMEWGNAAVPTVQYTHGMLSCSEFTGVPLSLLLEMAGYDKAKAKYILAEGADGSAMTRTIDLERALDDVIVAYGMNGEMLRPENGYPLRLVVPGVQGVSSVKWLRRIEVGDQPYATKDEAIHYIDLMPDGQHRQYTSIQEAKSVITNPSGGQRLMSQGFYNVTGLAWSGRGTVKKVDVSFDGGRNWYTANLEGAVLPKALTRFNIGWVWDGKPAILQSRVTDSTGYVQPMKRQLKEVRGSRSVYHNNAIQSWRVNESGEVENVQTA
ncbi:sulfite dehydrogenase [Spongiibacter sp. KMU-158]|uniref:Sulfite dehydrogenase n=1 Tax=Spongiibacter pelagi TaxID=2760804 RepID=A0A927C577_9GAMM|nr:sulfite dehydrogenase [Spongiibacter pelagi]MBD2860227.1 sulfite dehydrogenase [Spongiibacter pelagi]